MFHSVTKLFYDRGWSGINIEPNPELFKLYKKTRRRDINVNHGVSDKSGDLTFRSYPHHTGLSTFSKTIMKLHEAEDLPYEEYSVPVKTLSQILKEHKVKRIDFMKIDVEGYEIEVIKGNDWEKYRPAVLVIEATVRKQLVPLMKKLDYSLEFFDGLNLYYVDKRADEILTIYNYAPTVLGKGYYTSLEHRLLKRVEELEGALVEATHRFEDVTQHLENLLSLRGSVKASARAARRYVGRHTPQRVKKAIRRPRA